MCLCVCVGGGGGGGQMLFCNRSERHLPPQQLGDMEVVKRSSDVIIFPPPSPRGKGRGCIGIVLQSVCLSVCILKEAFSARQRLKGCNIYPV